MQKQPEYDQAATVLLVIVLMALAASLCVLILG
jgi:hypothetical protein